MIELKYKTRGNSSSQGKPRVYFSCHPKDFKAYFEKISDEILKEQNCAIWYNDDIPYVLDVDCETDLNEKLADMQLFVIPVTLKLLTEKSRTIDYDLQFAIEHHIPILPLIQESNLEELFAKKFGDIQYLDSESISKDSTAISYNERLSKYLSSVLIGDELASKIRAAFDAYIFLSYRKKDRKYAQELMRLIHKIEFCRDFAIWYDEYLVPGEDFNNAIAEALKKSELFALVVTPSLLELNNYIIEHEYPMAQKYEKTILPIELVETDKVKLSELYKKIPEVTDVRNDELFASVLIESMRKVATRKDKDNPEHNFFIGLAYLSGIDVEVDHEKAVGLIANAAENGVCEAIKKLVYMYRNGEAIEKNFEVALKWQNNLCDILCEEYEKGQDACTCNNYVDSLLDLSEFYIEQHNYCSARDVLKKALQVCEATLEKYNDSDTKHLLFVTYFNLIVIFKDTDKKKAKEIGEIFCNKSNEIYFENPSQEIKYDMYISYLTLGCLYLDERELSKALKYLQESYKILNEMDESETKSYDLANVLCYLGDVLYFEKEYDKAHSYFVESIEIRKSLASENYSFKNRRNLAIGYSKLGRIAEASGDYEKAIEFYNDDLKLTKELADETLRFDAFLELSLCYENLGHIYGECGKYKKAKMYWLQCQEILTKLYEVAKTNKITIDIARSYFNLGTVYEAESDYETAEKYYLESLELNEKVENNESHYSSRREILATYCYLGDIYLKNKKYFYASRYYRKYYDTSKKLYDETETLDAKREYAVSCGKRGYVNFLQGNIEKSWEFYLENLKTFQEIAEQARTVEAKRDLTSSYYNLMSVAYSTGKMVPAKIYMQEAMSLSMTLATSPGTHSDLHLLASVYLFCGDVKKDKQITKKAYEIWERIAKENPEMKEYEEKRNEAWNLYCKQ